LHRYHFYVEQGLPKTPVLLWVYGEQVRAVCDSAMLANYHCRYNPRDGNISDLRDGVFYATRFASLQGELIPFNPQDSLEAVRKLTSNKSIAYRPLKVWQEIDCPVSLFLALPSI
jgi:hypothetical protein